LNVVFIIYRAKSLSMYEDLFLSCWFSLTVPLRWCCLPMIRIYWHNLRNCCSQYLLTYGAEPFLRSCQLCSHSRLLLSIHLIMWPFLSQMLQLNSHQWSVLFQNRTSLQFPDSFTWTVNQHNH
jgi:hypothetical protein